MASLLQVALSGAFSCESTLVGAESGRCLVEPCLVHGAIDAAALRTEEDRVFGGVAAFQGRTSPSHEWLFMNCGLLGVHPAEIASQDPSLQRTG